MRSGKPRSRTCPLIKRSLKEDGERTALALYEAKKRAEMLRFRAKLDADPETMKQVEAQIAKDNARLTKELKSIDKQISETGGMASGYDDSWNMSEERVNELRAQRQIPANGS